MNNATAYETNAIYYFLSYFSIFLSFTLYPAYSGIGRKTGLRIKLIEFPRHGRKSAALSSTPKHAVISKLGRHVFLVYKCKCLIRSNKTKLI